MQKLEYWLCKCSQIQNGKEQFGLHSLQKLLTTHVIINRREPNKDSEIEQFSDSSDSEEESSTYNGNQNTNDCGKILRNVFLSFFVSLLKRYPMHIFISEKDKIIDLEKVFDSTGFLSDQMVENKPFFEQLLKTQMFTYFLQQKISSKSNDIFEKKVLNWIQRYVAELSLLSATNKSEYCYKKGHFVKNWKYRYFELQNDILKYYTNESKNRLRGSIRIISGVTKITIPEAKPNYPTKYPFRIETRNLVLECCAQNGKSRNEWIKLLSAKALDESKRESLIKTFTKRQTLSTNSKLVSREEPYLAFIKLTKKFIPQPSPLQIRFSTFENQFNDQKTTDVSSDESDEETNVKQGLPTDMHPLKD
jgi:hypothetical protein